jgi:hypothetical protein
VQSVVQRGHATAPEPQLELTLGDASLASCLGGVLVLFGGAAVVTTNAILRLRTCAPWTAGALAAGTAMWSIEWIGALLRLTMVPVSLQIAYGWSS